MRLDTSTRHVSVSWLMRGARRCADLGFEDCSARVEEAVGLSQATPFVAEHVELTPKDWVFYSFNVTGEDYQVVINVDSENNTQCAPVMEMLSFCPASKQHTIGMAALLCRQLPRHRDMHADAIMLYLYDKFLGMGTAVVASPLPCTCAGMNLGYTGLFAKYGQPPGWRYGQWDFRPEWDYYSERESDLEIRFDATHSAWQLGARPGMRLCRAGTAQAEIKRSLGWCLAVHSCSI